MNLQKRVAYFTPEIAVHDSFHNYAGGQGVVAGGMLRAAAAMGLPMTGVSILWRCGYYDQRLGSNGMEIHYIPRDYNDILIDTGVKVKVQVGGNPNTLIKLWLLKPEVFGTVPIILLDTDIKENDSLSRSITHAVYSGGDERRLAQKIVLGRGGVKALQALGLTVDIYHLNEGETSLVIIELLHQKMTEGLSFQDSLEWVKEHVVSTTHTPELSGNQSYNIDLMMWLGCLSGFNRQQAVFLGGEPFNPTIMLLKTSKKANAVSELHCETANRSFGGVDGRCEIIPITNGVVDEWWQPAEFQGDKTPEEIKLAKLPYQRILFDSIKEQSGKIFREDVLTIGAARRWAEYKRIDLIMRDQEWFKNLLMSGRIQLILAGKPHPDDWFLINLWNNVWRMSQGLPNIVILAGYELDMMRLLKIGVNVWLNTPRRPREACGTSGMSAAAVGTVPVSIKDGWAIEGKIGFLCGVDCPCENQDRLDADDLKKCIGEVADTFYGNKKEWDRKMLAGKKVVEQSFSTKRMLTDYVNKLYG